MRGLLLRKLLATTNRSIPILKPTTSLIPNVNPITQKSHLFPHRFRYFSSDNGNTDSGTDLAPPEPKNEILNEGGNTDSGTDLAPDEPNKEILYEDVSNEDYRRLIDDYVKRGNEGALEDIFAATIRRKISGKHEDTDDEILDEIRVVEEDPDTDEEELWAGLDKVSPVDKKIKDLYNPRDLVIKRKMGKSVGNRSIFSDEIDWDKKVREAVANGDIHDPSELQDLLENMLQWDNLLPDEIKMEVENKFDEIGERIRKGELSIKEGNALFEEFEDQVVLEHTKMEEEDASQLDGDFVNEREEESDDPPGEGPILRWETRVVLSHGSDSWHPKNRKVKLSVTVKELGLSEYQFVRLTELVGKRYNPENDELTIISQRFEHREENRKDCLRTLYSLIEEAGKATELVERALIELKANPEFMRLQEAEQQKGI